MPADRPSPFTIPAPAFEFAEGPPSDPAPLRRMTVGMLIQNLTGFATFYETATRDIDDAPPLEKQYAFGAREANADSYLKQFRATAGIDRVRGYVLGRYGEELTITTARRLLSDLVREYKLSVETAEGLLLQDAMDVLDGANAGEQVTPTPFPATDETKRDEMRPPGETPPEKSPDVGRGESSAPSLGELLAAVRELRRALEHPVPYPERPGKTRVELTDDRAEAIRRTFAGVLRHSPDALPPGVEMKLDELLNDYRNLFVREVEDPNRLHRRAINAVRDVEASLCNFDPEPEPDEPDAPTPLDVLRQILDQEDREREAQQIALRLMARAFMKPSPTPSGSPAAPPAPPAKPHQPATPSQSAALPAGVREWLVARYLADPTPGRWQVTPGGEPEPVVFVRFEDFAAHLSGSGILLVPTLDHWQQAGWIADCMVDVTPHDDPSRSLPDCLAPLNLPLGRHRLVGIRQTVLAAPVAPATASVVPAPDGARLVKRDRRPPRDPNQPGRDRQQDILAAIRAAETPLTRPELVEALRLGSDGKLGGNLAWMVKNGILVNIPQRGYWPSNEPMPE